MRNSHLIALFALATCASCASARKDSLPTDTYILSSWETSITHLGAEAYTSLGYAYANDTLQAKVRQLSRDTSDEIYCYIVPQSSGYKIVVLSRHQMSLDEQRKILALVNESLRIGSEEASKITKT